MDRVGGEALGLGTRALSHCQGLNKRDRRIALQIAACLLCIRIDVVAFSGLTLFGYGGSYFAMHFHFHNPAYLNTLFAK